jgi:eukaryotic-like serine/threonine-protein kinase
MKCPKCHSDVLDDSRFCSKCGEPIHSAEKDLVSFTKTLVTPSSGVALGSLLAGKYRILEEVGRGGMGVVYKAEDLKLKRPVALKFLPPEWGSHPEARERFIQEARAAAALSHPNICTIHEVDEGEGKPFIAMEFIEGENLRDKVKKGPLPVDIALDFVIQAAKGLEKAHQKGIVHRDIKTANIMVTESGQVKIMDFGLAKLQGGSSFTQEGATLGTVAYMSPEQARGEKVDGRTDLWSLGVVLYEMLTGDLPFRGERDVSVLYSIVHEEPKALKDAKPPVPPELQHVIERALNKDPGQRYQTAGEMIKDLSDYQEALKREAAGVFNLGSFLKRLRRPVVAIPTILAVIAIALFAVWFFGRQAKVRWARKELLPRIGQLAELRATLDYQGMLDYAKIYELAVEAEKCIPRDPQLAKIFANFSTPLNILTDPAGAKVYVKYYHEPEKGWGYLGESPIKNQRMPIAFLRLRMEKEGYEPVLAAAVSWGEAVPKARKRLPGEISAVLEKKGAIPAGMVRVTGVEIEGTGKFEDFYMDRFEVTNKQYREFILNGGYQKREYWKNNFVKEGKPLTWEQAMAACVDKTGLAGPAAWQAGDYPEGQDDYPVSGISWYEAAAYAEYAGKTLPSGYHWEIARGNLTALIESKSFSEFFIPQSNFKGKGPERVGSNPAITPYGLYDMGGNVREWCFNETQIGRLVRGGAWDDVSYMFGDLSQLPPFDRSAKNGFRCCLYIHPEKVPKAALALKKIVGFPDFYKQKPVSDQIFQVYKEQYAYDKVDLDSRLELRDDTAKEWVIEKVSFAAAYENERVPAFLYLPRNSSPPFQTIIFFPGLDAAWAGSSKDLEKLSGIFEKFTSFFLFPSLVKNGRAVMFPVYKGTFERGSDALLAIQTGADTRQYTEYFIKVVKDFRRSIDYLETRSDIDSKKLAYLGFSWGGIYGAIIPAIEERLKVSILNGGGMWGNTRPEVDGINYVTRVKVPTLMLNGRYDMTFPFELTVKPMFDLLGTPAADKRLILYDTDHIIPLTEYIKETLAWLDKYLGPIKK